MDFVSSVWTLFWKKINAIIITSNQTSEASNLRNVEMICEMQHLIFINK